MGMAEDFNKMIEEFEAMVVSRHQKGQQVYGEFTFLGKDIVQMMLEELADTVNYCRYQAVKLMLLQRVLLEDPGVKKLAEENGNIEIGVEAFKPTGEGWKK